MADEAEKDALTVEAEVEETGPCNRRITFTVPPEQVEKEFSATYEEVKHSAQIPGFRPGKAPRQVVETRLGKSFREKALSRIRLRAYGQAVREHKLKPIRSPEFKDISYEKGQPFSFQATVEVIPEITLPEYKGIKIDRKEAPPTTDEDVAAEVDRVREEFAEFALVEDRPLRNGDFAVVSYEEEAEGRTEKFERRVVEMAPDSLLPGFAEKIRGMKPGDRREFQIQIPDDYSDKEAAGKTVNYRLELVEIREKELPQADDELAKKVGAPSMEELTRRLRERLMASRDREAEADEIGQIVSYLLKNTDCEVPQSLLAEGTRERVSRRVRAGLRAGVSTQYLHEKREEIVKDAAAQTYANLKLEMILPKIAETEGITVSDEEVEARIEHLAAAANVDKDEWKKRYRDEDRFDDVRYDLLEQKVLNFLHNSAVKE
jgi:trigger factor